MDGYDNWAERGRYICEEVETAEERERPRSYVILN